MPTVPTFPTKASAAKPGSTCDLTAIGQNGSAYFPQKDAGIALVSAFRKAYGDGPTSTTTVSAGWAVIDRIGDATFEGVQTSTATVGAALTRGVLSCLSTAVPSLSASLGTTTAAIAAFNSAITNALSPGGLYVVPDLAAATPALGRGSSPAWGAEPKSGENWGSIYGAQFLLFGYPLTFSEFTTESAAGTTGTAFELDIAPKSSFGKQMRVGVCVENDDRYRMQHVNTVLPLVATSTAFCTTPTSPPSPSSSSLAGLTRAITSFFTPKPAYAVVLGGGSSSLLSSLSPSGAVDIDASTISLTIDQITGGKISKPVNITVHAATENEHPVGDVLVRLAVAGNFGIGSDGEFEVTNYSGRTVDGTITFSVTFLKPGSYTIRADGFFNGVDELPTQSALSNTFGMTGGGKQ